VTGHEYRVLSSQQQFHGVIFDVVTDQVTMPGGASARRDYTRHLGAAAVVALDDDDRVTLVRQYRHAVGAHLYELPAGLSDVRGESGVRTAQRELAEEVDLTAAQWNLLVEVHTSPGFSDELVRVFLARRLSPVADADRHVRRDEEADLTVHHVPLDEAVAMVFRGEITNGVTAVGLLAAARARDLDWTPLRPAS
jgi:ADP-ribose pyrophosphatase